MTELRVVAAEVEPIPAPAPLITLPIVLIALLKFSDFGVRLNKARNGASTWYFRFSPTAILEVHEEGEWCWRRGSLQWRRRIAPFLARAEAILAENPPRRAVFGSGIGPLKRLKA
jgi:hypothetical protein